MPLFGMHRFMSYPGMYPWMFVGIGLFLMLFLSLLIYLYVAAALYTVAKKLKYDKAWIAWIPVANMFLLPVLAKDWNWYWGFMFLVPIANVIFFIIWTWQIFEKRRYPGALSLMAFAMLVPFIGTIAYLLTIGIVAWNDSSRRRGRAES